MALLRFWVDATQAKAELASLAAVNRMATAGIQASWGAVNKAMLAGAAGIGAMAVGMAAAYGANAEFNKSLTHTRALSDLTTEQLNKMGDAALALGIQFGESSNVIADGLVVLSKAGLTYEEIMTAMPTIVKMMKANAVDFETAAKISIMSINAFGKEYSDLADIADKTQKVVQATLLDLVDMQQALQYAGSTAALAGIPFESLAAMMGVLSDNAMVAGIASRSVNMMMLDIVEHTDEIQRWADSMGLGVQVIKDGVLNINEIIPAFAKLGMNLETLIESQDIFTARALRSWGILIGHSGDYLDLLDQINTSTGELDRTVAIQMEGLTAVMTQIKEIFFEPFKEQSAAKELAAILDDLKGIVGELAPTLKELVFSLMRGFADILPEINQMLQGFVGLVGTLLKIIVPLGKAIAGIPAPLLQGYIVIRLLMRSKIVQWLFNFVLGARTLTTSLAEQRLETEMLALSQQRLEIQLKKAQFTEMELELRMRTLNEALVKQHGLWSFTILQLNNVSKSTELLALENQKLALSYDMEANANRISTLQKQIDTMKTNDNTRANAANVAVRQMLVGAIAGIAMGLWMLYSGYNKETRLMGALVTAIMAGTVAYYALAAARAAALPGQAPSQFAAHAGMTALGIAATAGGLGAIYAYAAPERSLGIEEYEMPVAPRTYGSPVSGFQRGTRVVGGTRPRLAVVHPQEAIVSANKDPITRGAGLTINMAPGVYVLDHGGFLDWLDEELSSRSARQLGRYIR